jgi:hypothetical protein
MFPPVTIPTPTTKMASSQYPPFEALTLDYSTAPKATLSLLGLDELLPFNIQLEMPEPARYDFGLLSILPAEIILMIIEPLPLRDLMRFRNSNKSTKHLLNTLPKFQRVVRYGLDTLKGIMAIQTTSEITLAMLHLKLTQRHCDNCERPAPLIWLPTCLRVCLQCPHPSGFIYPLLPLGMDMTLHTYGLQQKDLAHIPSYRVLSIDSEEKSITPHRGEAGILYDADTAAKLCFERRGTWEDLSARSSSPSRHGVMDWRQMATTFALWLTVGSITTETARFCSTCRYTKRQDRLYTRETFQGHLKVCRVRPFDIDSKLERRFQVAVS